MTLSACLITESTSDAAENVTIGTEERLKRKQILMLKAGKEMDHLIRIRLDAGSRTMYSDNISNAFMLLLEIEKLWGNVRFEKAYHRQGMCEVWSCQADAGEKIENPYGCGPNPILAICRCFLLCHELLDRRKGRQ